MLLAQISVLRFIVRTLYQPYSVAHCSSSSEIISGIYSEDWGRHKRVDLYVTVATFCGAVCCNPLTLLVVDPMVTIVA